MKLSSRVATHVVIGAGAIAAAAALAACSDAKPADPAAQSTITYRTGITPVTRKEDAQPGVFIPPFVDCRPPAAGEATTAPGGKVCTPVSIAGATEPNKSFASYASCDIVRTQRPYYPRPPAKVPAASDPRLGDASFMAELAWAKSQIAATGCACCHDSKVVAGGSSQWDISASPIWLDTLSDKGLALFGGYADSSVLGAYPSSDNHGFDRTATGIPTTDTARMRAFVDAELKRRGISEPAARAVAPFGGPIYDNFVRPAKACEAGEGVDPQGRVVFDGKARYLYVLEAGSKNPGVPPNLDHPEGLVWRLDVLASANPVESGLAYATTPAGSFQDVPAQSVAPALVRGRTYQLTALRDVGIPSTNCLFVYGEPLTPRPPTPPAPPPAPEGGTVDSSFGALCKDSAGCTGKANYCALQPGSPDGYCTVTGCKEAPSVCPAAWSCFDLSVFQPGAPAFCRKP